MAKRQTTTSKSGLRKLALPALVLALTGAVLAAINFTMFYRPGPLEAETTVIIPNGASLTRISEILGRRGVISFPQSFYWTGRLFGAAGELKAGEYRIPEAASQAQVLIILRKGETVLHKLTVPEGLTSREVVALLRAEDKLSGEIGKIPPEGSLLPETYLFSRGDSRAALIEKMRQSQKALLDQLWAAYDFSLPFTSPREAVTLASLVEEETAVPEERPLIAAVFINRLEKGMKLQSDPTVVYGISGGAPLGERLRQSQLDAETPYNTYLIEGLPPGPISNPGRAALEAVFDPAETDALYFVADGSGGHVFAATLEEHNRNVARWRKIQRENSGS